jgi:hypothetical protein
MATNTKQIDSNLWTLGVQGLQLLLSSTQLCCASCV